MFRYCVSVLSTLQFLSLSPPPPPPPLPFGRCPLFHPASINYTVVVRNCVVDDGGTNSETEIGRESHCGWMRVLKYNGRRMRGCILSCDTDACNHGNRPQRALTSPLTLLVSAVSLLVASFVCRPTTG